MTEAPRALRLWLSLCCAMIFAMAVIGAITRLTESGLSIVEWNPLTGAIPPLNEQDWQKAFTGYQQTPQYKLLNSGMTLTAFKQIFFWEWLHRLWGRLIGVVYALPFCYFLLRRQIPKPYVGKLWLGLLLGGLQGALGWFMVKSGLSELVYVSHYRLAAHLVLALAIYAYLFWLCLMLAGRQRHQASPCLIGHGRAALGLLAVTITWGAFVAGLKAGWAYNTFPLMDGEIVPSASWTMIPLWQNFLANTALVQFCHRVLAMTTGLALWFWAWRLWRGWYNRKLALALGLMALVQIGLGIATLLTQVQIVLGTLHQAGAIVLLTLLLRNLYGLRPVQT